MSGIERLSIEVTNKCAKACSFCYNSSLPGGSTTWTDDTLVDFVTDCSGFGVKAVSFGGGEPFQYEGIFAVLTALRGKLFRSLTTNGLLLEANWNKLLQAQPDKVHVSIHFPDKTEEVERVISQVNELAEAGIKSGVNFLVRKSMLNEAMVAAQAVRERGISNDRIVYLPMRGVDTPTPRQVASVAGNLPFQSMSCLSKCAASPRFCSIGWDKKVGWCSYTSERADLADLTFAGLQTALNGLGLVFCGGTDD